ncbi:MAG: HAMP domain-containing protein [Acidobacteria bacterium]|nr:HAMP domain-containing protein [Acidobacteriota bacterium]
MAAFRVNLKLKAVLPLAGVLLAGILAFVWITLSLEGSERQTVILVALAGAIAICAAMLAILAVLVQHPLVELREKIARLRAGDLTVSVGFSERNDEIGDLGRDFNEMVRQLRETREELERLYSTQMSRAEHLATLGELAAGLAHDIRNPLAGIAGVMEIIARDLPVASPSRQVLNEVQEEILHIQKILSDMLAYARPKPPYFREADLNETAEHAVALARQQVLSRPIQIEITKDQSLPPVEHDITQVRQLLLNLLLNAIQGIEGTGRVDVKLESRDGQAVMRVRDTGRGIAPENLPQIFRPFFTTKGQGTGLGLSLARRIVENHGGRIEVSSTLGQGSEFTVWLPLRKTTPGSAPS